MVISCLKFRNLAKVHKVVPRDHQVTLKLTEDQLDNNQKNCQILREDLRLRKIFAKLVPHSFMNEQKAHSITTGENIFQTCHVNPHFLSRIITGNESWIIFSLKFPISKVQF